MKNFRFWETMVGDIMCLFRSKESAQGLHTESEQKVRQTEQDNLKREVIDAYWVRGNERWFADTVDELVSQNYCFGAPVCRGKLTITLRKNQLDAWYRVGTDIEDESLVSVVDDQLVYQAVKENFCWIDTEEEWRSVHDNQDYYDVFIPKKVAAVLSGKYSESFAVLLAPYSKYSKELVNKAIALYDEGLSPDMRAYLLFKDIEKRTG